MTAATQQHVGGALGDEHCLVVVFVVARQDGHHLAFGGKRDFSNAFKTLLPPHCQAKLLLGHQKGGLGGVAMDLPRTACVLAQFGVAGQTAAAEQHQLFGVQSTRCCEWHACELHPTDRRVADTGYLSAARGGHHPNNSHFRPG